MRNLKTALTCKPVDEHHFHFTKVRQSPPPPPSPNRLISAFLDVGHEAPHPRRPLPCESPTTDAASTPTPPPRQQGESTELLTRKNQTTGQARGVLGAWEMGTTSVGIHEGEVPMMEDEKVIDAYGEVTRYVHTEPVTVR
jgi:hypothetical protein